MNKLKTCGKLKPIRSGIHDVWNAFMVEGADFGTNSNDIPFCPTTAKAIPKRIVDWDEARKIYSEAIARHDNRFHYDAFVCFFVDDRKFSNECSESEKGYNIWREYLFVLKVLRHFAGAITPDFSLCQDFPHPIKIYNVYRMRAYGFWLGKNGIPIINGVRWGTSETYNYVFDGLPHNSVLCIGTSGGSPRKLVDRDRFEAGLQELINRLHPHTILVYGSANYRCFDTLRQNGITIIEYPSRTARVFEGRRRV
ncbi:MAG: DUF4417 domain-containing protein [Lachnospiraceae bacterium]|nr:DUF4417 domain-containing protein [Lachnospiraceae bacterium]